MSRRFTGPHTGHGGLRNISASRYALFQLCQRRWAFRMLEKLPEAQGAAAEQGTGHHTEMENWEKYGILPTTRPACAALKYAPAPGYSSVEVPVWVQTPKSSWLGFIDSAYDIVIKREPVLVVEDVYQKQLHYWEFAQPELMHERPIGPWRQNGEWFSDGFEYAELGTTTCTVIHDWKFTGNIKNTKSAYELRDDPAVILYALEAFQGGAQRVFCRWVYIQMKGTPTSREIWFEVTADHVLEQLELMDDVAAEMQQLYQIRAKGASLPMPPHPDQSCFAFGKQCDYYDVCQPPTAISMSRIGAPDMSEAFKSSMLASFPKAPALPGAVPALPLAPSGIPALPPKVPALPVPSIPMSTAAESAEASALVAATYPHLAKFLDKEPSIESGSINSPEAPVVPSATPEQAIVHQAIPAAPGPIVDDLDGMTDEALKALGVALGAFPQSSKMRRPGRIGAIRVKRLEGATHADAQGAHGAAAAVDQLEAELMAAETGTKAPPLPVPVVERGTDKATKITHVEAPAFVDPIYPAFLDDEREDAKVSGIGGLFINCIPEGGHTSLTMLLEILRPAFKAAAGVEDYRLVKYGEGVGMMAVGLRDHLSAHYVQALVVDTHTQEGVAFLGAVQPFADLVVRGF